MNREDIIRMAREANIKQAIETPHLLMVHELERFAALVAAAEREACAKVCDRQKLPEQLVHNNAVMACRNAIRARGQTDKTCPPCHGDCNQGRTCPARGGHA